MLINQKLLFNKEECDLIINLSKINFQNWNKLDRNYNSYAIQYNETTNWIFDKLKYFFETETDIQIKTIKKQIHFHTFKNGQWFGKHNDNRDNRIYAIGVLLNDNFKGGDFKLYNPNEIVLDKIAGNTYLFDVKIKHKITEVKNKDRYSLIWFLQNENLKLNNEKLL